MTTFYYTSFSSTFESFTIVWKEIDSNVLIQRLFLSDNNAKSETRAYELFDNVRKGSSKEIDEHGKKVQQFLEGNKTTFDLKALDFNRCSEIQKKVLIAEYNIPRGWISTYKRIVNHIGIKNGARVVGNSLARNPFPIFIPYHRAIKSDGTLGGYQGGLEMKRTLLEMEGVKILEKGKVLTDKIHY